MKPRLPPELSPPSSDPKIYLLPNLMTAGNLFCGFAATLKILAGTVQKASTGEHVTENYHAAILFILGACIFDLLDGRLARLGGHDSPFGREFDSLADLVSFGIAPALLVYKIVLEQFDRLGLFVAFVYLACGALRLARFNCVAAAAAAEPPPRPDTAPGTPAGQRGTDQFLGFPIPAAAGLIASLTLCMLWLQQGNVEIGWWKFLLPPLMLFLSFMMFSRYRYPSFKAVHWRTQRSLPTFLLITVLLVFAVLNYQWMPALLFFLYLMYGFLRPWLALGWQRRMEEFERRLGEEPEGPEPAGGDGGAGGFPSDDGEAGPARRHNGHPHR